MSKIKTKYSSITFEDFLRNNADVSGIIASEFRLVVNKENNDGSIEIYCHPLGRDGETYDGIVKKFSIYHLLGFNNLLKCLIKKSN